MTVELSRFGLNRKAIPGRSLDEFFSFVQSLGIHDIELRNDMTDSNNASTIIDNGNVEDFKKLHDKYQMNILTFNAISLFNKPEKLQDNLKLLEEMCQLSNQIGNDAIIFCPDVDGNDKRTVTEKLDDAVHNLREYGKVLNKYHLNGLIEPLGFKDSTLRYPWEALRIIDYSGLTNFKIVVDTFHFYLAHITAEEFKNKVDIDKVGLVHLSGIDPIHEIREVQDQDRLFVSNEDILQNVEQVQLFEKLGYQGKYSFEAFSDSLINYSDQELSSAFKESVSLVH